MSTGDLLPNVDPFALGVHFRNGLLQFPVRFVRGGTSTGLVIEERHAPGDIHLREELVRHLMGVPIAGAAPGNRQLTGLGRGSATSNKVFFVKLERHLGMQRIVSTLAQLAPSHSDVDWSVGCGNMSAALPLWALEAGVPRVQGSAFEIDIRNTNTGVVTTARALRDTSEALALVEIPGVLGRYPGVDLFLHDPTGSKTGRLLPTGSPVDRILGHDVSCVDVAVPMVILDAASFGKTAHESIKDLESDGAFIAELRNVWIEAGLRMGLSRRDGLPMSRDEISRSETIPKVCIVGRANGGGDLAVRYFTPQTAHASMAVSGACCLAAAALIPGTVASRVRDETVAVERGRAEYTVGIENPAGILEATVVASTKAGELLISTVAYRRSAQIIHTGYVTLYATSEHLLRALSGLAT